EGEVPSPCAPRRHTRCAASGEQIQHDITGQRKPVHDVFNDIKRARVVVEGVITTPTSPPRVRNKPVSAVLARQSGNISLPPENYRIERLQNFATAGLRKIFAGRENARVCREVLPRLAQTQPGLKYESIPTWH